MGAAPPWPLYGVRDAVLRLTLGCPCSETQTQPLWEQLLLVAVVQSPVLGTGIPLTHSFPLGGGTNLWPEKLSPALRDLAAEAQEIPLLCFSIEVVMLTGQ